MTEDQSPDPPPAGLKELATRLQLQVEAFHQRIPASIRRPLTAVVGIALLSTGVLLLVLPGPGLLVIALGAALLALEFRWVRRLLVRLRARASSMRSRP